MLNPTINQSLEINHLLNQLGQKKGSNKYNKTLKKNIRKGTNKKLYLLNNKLKNNLLGFKKTR